MRQRTERIDTYIVTTVEIKRLLKWRNQIEPDRVIAIDSPARGNSELRVARLLSRRVARELNNVELKVTHTDKLCENEN